MDQSCSSVMLWKTISRLTCIRYSQGAEEEGAGHYSRGCVNTVDFTRSPYLQTKLERAVNRPAVLPKGDCLPNVPMVPMADTVARSVPSMADAPLETSSALWRVGSKLQALDCRNMWCDATVIDARGNGCDREIKVHYMGWKKRWDEWVLSRSVRLRPRLENAASTTRPWWGHRWTKIPERGFST